MKNKLTIFLSVIALVVSAGSIVLYYFNTPKIGYVRSVELFEKYEGMKDAKKKYEQKVGSIQSNYDTLAKDYQYSLNKLNLDFAKLNEREKNERTTLLKSQLANLQQYKQNLEEQIQKEDDILTEGIYNQMNAYIKEFGESHGFTMILGTTNNGNILYAKDYVDVTEKVLIGLNKKYSGKGEK